MVPAGPPLSAPLPPPAPAPAAPARALIEGQLAMLTRLAQIGMEMAEACSREARSLADAPAPAEGPPARDPGLTFARVARAVRMTIALQSRLLGDLAGLDRAQELGEQARKDRRRMRLRQLTQQAAEARVEAEIDAGRLFSGEDAILDEIERLGAEAYERLTDAEDGFGLDRPFAEAVAAICADLKLSPQWIARLDAAVAPPPGAAHGPAPEHSGGEAAARASSSAPPGPAVAQPWPAPPQAQLCAIPGEAGPSGPPSPFNSSG